MQDGATTSRYDTTGDARALADRWVALWNGKAAPLDGLVAEGVVTHAVMAGDTAETTLVGRAALGGWIAALRGAMPALRFAIEVGPMIDGDLIALRWRCAGPHGHARIDFAGTDILRVADGRIAEYWVSSDVAVMMAQMGAAMPAS